MAVLVSCATSPRAGDSKAAEDAIRAQIVRYLAAIDAADTSLAAQVWRTSDMSFIHPAGHARDWEQMKAVYEFFGATFTERKLTARDISVHVNGDSAWAEYYWHFDATPVGGAPVQSDGRESQVYVRDGDRWELVHAHYSGPAMEFPQ